MLRALSRRAAGGPLSRAFTSGRARAATFGVVLDVDGVLVKGGTPIEGAKETLMSLSASQSHPKPEQRIPYLIITNGGGVLETVKTREINDVFFPGLPNPIAESQVLLSHTPMKSLVSKYKDKPVLVLGSKDYVGVAKGYGFQKVVTVEDILHAHPEVYPFKSFHQHPRLFEKEPIAAVLVLYDPTDWATEIQVICDIAHGGVLPDGTGKRPAPIPIYTSNSDLIFSSNFPTPRLAQGAFTVALQHVYKEAYGGGHTLPVQAFGKPMASTYRYAEVMLLHEARRLELVTPDPPTAAGAKKEHHPFPLKRVYAIGDNPASDIKGANKANGHVCEWVSILVRTGIFKGENDTAHPAKYVVDSVHDAWRLIHKLEGYKN